MMMKTVRRELLGRADAAGREAGVEGLTGVCVSGSIVVAIVLFLN